MRTLWLALCIGLVASGVQAAEDCTEIRFAPGATSAEIQGAAPAEGVICFRVRTGAGQQARIQVLEGQNTIATIPDEAGAEARQDISFTTQARQYEILVGQLMRAVESEPFRMLVSVR